MCTKRRNLLKHKKMFVFTLFYCITIIVYNIYIQWGIHGICKGTTIGKRGVREKGKSKFSRHWIWITSHLSYISFRVVTYRDRRKENLGFLPYVAQSWSSICSFRRVPKVKNFGALCIHYTYIRFSIHPMKLICTK